MLSLVSANMKRQQVLGLLAFVLGLSQAALSDNNNFQAYCESWRNSGAKPRNCLDLMCDDCNVNGVYTIYPFEGKQCYKFEVYCDQTTEGGGWTVIQSRLDGSVDFFRTYRAYQLGFGNMNGEYWLGLDKMNQILDSSPNGNELRIDMEDMGSTSAYAQYSDFKMSGADDRYKLTSLGTYTGTAGDSLEYHLGAEFYTWDADVPGKRCAMTYEGAWWYVGCHKVNLNGRYLAGPHRSFANGINWFLFKGYNYSLKTTSMKVRAKL